MKERRWAWCCGTHRQACLQPQFRSFATYWSQIAPLHAAGIRTYGGSKGTKMTTDTNVTPAISLGRISFEWNNNRFEWKKMRQLLFHLNRIIFGLQLLRANYWFERIENGWNKIWFPSNEIINLTFVYVFTTAPSAKWSITTNMWQCCTIQSSGESLSN